MLDCGSCECGSVSFSLMESFEIDLFFVQSLSVFFLAVIHLALKKELYNLIVKETGNI